MPCVLSLRHLTCRCAKCSLRPRLQAYLCVTRRTVPLVGSGALYERYGTELSDSSDFSSIMLPKKRYHASLQSKLSEDLGWRWSRRVSV